MVSIFACFIVYFLKTPKKLTLIVSILSFGVSTIDFLLAAIVTLPIGVFISLFTHQYPSETVSITLVCVLQLIFATIPFLFRRFKKGMPFLYEYSSSDLAFYLGITLLLAISFFGISKNAYLVFTIPVFFTILCGLTLVFWWKNNLTKRYIDKINAKERNDLHAIIDEKDKQIEELKFHNNELSKIIHKDNKLIPALELAVREYLSSASQECGHQLHIDKGNELIKQLKGLTLERAGILQNYESKSKKLTLTNILPIDNLFSYMLQKANNLDIVFDVSLTCSLKHLTRDIINEEDLRTLFADLIDNAIIATKNEKIKRIMININKYNGHYFIDILDSGAPFKPEVLLNLGLKQTTTHANEGGSGIGLMSIYELTKNYKGSLEIEEITDNMLFTKRVSLVFDKLHQYRIKTMRKDVIDVLSSRKDIIVENSTITTVAATVLCVST